MIKLQLNHLYYKYKIFWRGFKITKSEKCSVTQKGRVTIHKGESEKRVYPDELANYINDGWEEGISEQHKINNSNSHKGKSAPNKGIPCAPETKKKISNTITSKLESGEITPSFLGHKHSKETKAKLAEYTGEKNSQYGKPKSDDWKKKTSDTHKRDHKLKDYLLSRSKEEKDAQVSKAVETKKKNGTLNTSKPEEQLFEDLKIKYPEYTIYRNYKCERYPFYCDFYIIEEDLFIELNAHWTHGGHPFDPNNEEDQKVLTEWKEKAKTSQYMANAIETWTVRDVKKAEWAKEHNLNYLVIY